MTWLALGIYRFVVIPIVVVALPVVALFNAKIKRGLQLRRRPIEPLKSGVQPVWIHAASGEFEYAKAVIRELKSRAPEIPVVVTYFSPTFARAASLFPGVDYALALPLDLPGPCRSFLRRIDPRILLIARTDLWPEMLEQCRDYGVPVMLFSYTQKPFRGRLKILFTSWMLHWITRVYCVADEDLNNVALAGAETPLEVMGDTRYDQVAYRLAQSQNLRSRLGVKPSTPCFVAGSTWPQDEAVLLPGLVNLLHTRRLKLILVPHEPTMEHVRELGLQLAALNLEYDLFSSEVHSADKPVMIVDQVGLLADIYASAQFALIGGSFRRSVHSVMEALGAGCLTFVGPFHENNREAVAFKDLKFGSYHGVEVIQDAADLEQRMTMALDNPAAITEFSNLLMVEFKRRLGASARLVSGLDLHSERARQVRRHDSPRS